MDWNDLMNLLGVQSAQAESPQSDGWAGPPSQEIAHAIGQGFRNSRLPAIAPVVAGTSGEEDQKALTKLNMAKARADEKKLEIQKRLEAELDQRLAMLQSASKAKDVFVSDGRRGERSSIESSDEGQGFGKKWSPAQGGSFTRSQRPTTEQNAIKRLVGQGMSSEKAQAILDGLGMEGARQAMASNATTNKGVSLEDILKLASGSKDVAGMVALLERLNILPPKA
jgi:hypothetical protein